MARGSPWVAWTAVALASACGGDRPAADAASKVTAAAAAPTTPAIPPEELTVVRDLGRPFAVRLPLGYTTSVTREGSLESDGAEVTVVEFTRGPLGIAVRAAGVRDPSIDEARRRMKGNRRVKVKFLREASEPDGWALAWERRDPGARPVVELVVYRRALELMCSASDLAGAKQIDEAIAICRTIQPYDEPEAPAAPKELVADKDCPPTCHLLMRCQVYGDEAGCIEACKAASGKDRELFRCFASSTSCDGASRCQGQ